MTVTRLHSRRAVLRTPRVPEAFFRRSYVLGLAVALIVMTCATVFAGGPLNPVFGDFERWDPAAEVPFVFDGGPLSPTIPGDSGADLVRLLLKTWEDVDTASIRFEDRGFLQVDIDQDNFQEFLSQGSPSGNPVVFDADGGIIDAVFGSGSSNSVLGFAAAFTNDGNDLFYDFGFAVLNGKRANVTLPTHVFRKTVLHELGHLLGLDHTQAGMRFFQTSETSVVPIMYPFISSVGTADLEQDDIAWISHLYPAPGNGQFGTISGRIFRRTGGPFLGANVEAVPVEVGTEGQILEKNRGFVSVVSDFLDCADGSFLIPGLMPGNYVVFIEALNPSFTAGSDVGPHPFRFTQFPKDYYNGEGESGDDTDDPLVKTVISVGTGQTPGGIEIVSNENMNQLASLGDDDEELYVFPSGFVFPFFGQAYRKVSVNSDGNLTFRGGDSASSPRDLSRFLAGFPRIAPLFTDLDPSSGGSISADFGEDQLTFRWTDVPEFDRFDGKTNSFSVTLYPNGNILFHYDTLAVTVDDPIENLQAIVGISPGYSRSAEICAPRTPAEGESQDFLSAVGPIPISTLALFETFSGSSLDLTGTDLLFEADSSQFFLYFPYLQGDEQDFTGFAVSNDSDAAAVLEIEARSATGALQPYQTNPRIRSLGTLEQFAEVGFAIFREPLKNPRDGWVRIGSNTFQLASFFQLGNGLDDCVVTRLYVYNALVEQSEFLYFTRLFDGQNLLLTPTGGVPVDAVTTFSLANPNSEPVGLEFTLFSKAGVEVVSGVNRQLPALGSLRETLASLFGSLGPVTDGFVRVRATSGRGAVGFELVSFGDTLLGFNASFGSESSTSYSAQLAHGQSGGVGIFTSLKLVNVSSSPRLVSITGLRDNGSTINVLAPFTLMPNQAFQQDVGQILGLGPPAGPAVTGSLRIQADGPGVIGDVVFGDPQALVYAAALPLQEKTFSRAIFSQVANLIDPNPRRSTFTGLAFHNPNPDPAEILVRVYSRQGALTGEETVVLGPGERMSEVLATLVPSTSGQVQGFIVIESDQPIVAQQLFGNPALDYLSAVPPTIVE